MAEKVDGETSIGSDEIPAIEELNPEGYGIEGEFVPTAVFDVFDESGPSADDNVFDADKVADSAVSGELEGEEGEEDDGEEEEGAGGMEEGEGEEQVEAELAEGEEAGEEKSEEEAKSEESEEEEKKEGEEEEKKEEEEEGEGVETQKEGEVEKTEEGGEPEKAGVQFGEGIEDEGGKRKPKKEMFRRRLSIRKKSIFYPMQARFRTTEERVSGDFTAVQEDLLGSTGSPPSILSFQPESDEYSFEEEVEEEEVPPIDREYYCNLYNTLNPERASQKMKNNFLHRKMADYFRKRKMEHVLKETDQQVDSQAKYVKKLDALADLRDLDTRERNCITTELNDMRSQRNDHRSILAVHFTAMQTREKEMGTGLINTKTGKEIPDKVIEHLLKRQRHKLNEIAKMRLTYIKIRDRVAEKKAALHALDCIGDNLHLIDYEQLKIENQSHTDKIEERDEELNKLRIKCQGAMQCLAHIREKSAAVLLDIQQLNERYEEVEMEFSECRERLNYFKLERDKYRFETDKLCDESGLLSKPKLLQDMERTMEVAEITSRQLADLKEENRRLTESLKAIKKNIQMAPKTIHVIKAPTEQPKTTTRKIYKGRPTLIYPQLPKSDWSDSHEMP